VSELMGWRVEPGVVWFDWDMAGDMRGVKRSYEIDKTERNNKKRISTDSVEGRSRGEAWRGQRANDSRFRPDRTRSNPDISQLLLLEDVSG